MTEFFTGYRKIHKFAIVENKGRTILECKVGEKWELILHDIARCGASITCKLVRKVGLKESDKKVLENHVKGSIGIKGLAKLEAQAKESLSNEVVWEKAIEKERTIVFPSPRYGRYTVLQYQKKRYYNLRFQNKRFLHKDSWQHSICENTNCYYDGSKSVQSDPSCDPPEQKGGDYDGLFQVDLGNISFLVGFNRQDKGVEGDFAGKKVKIKKEGNTVFNAILPKSLIPEALIFLGNITDDNVEANFKPYMESSIEIPLIHQEELDFKIGTRDQNTDSLEMEV